MRIVYDDIGRTYGQGRRADPRLATVIRSALKDASTVVNIGPADCLDRFLDAFWRRPEAYPDPALRAGMSSFARVVDVDDRLDLLRADILSGAWQRRHAELLERDALDIGCRLVVTRSRPPYATCTTEPRQMRLAELSGRRTAALAALWLFGAPVLIVLGMVLPSILLEELPAIGPCTLDFRVGPWLGLAIVGPPLALIAAWLGVRRRKPEAADRTT